MQVRLGGDSGTLVEQGFDDQDGHLQRDVDAINRLYVRGYISAGQRQTANQRLIKKLRVLPQADLDHESQ